MRILFRLLFLAPLGYLILLIKFRDVDKVHSIVESEYDDDYSNVAVNYLLSLIIFVLILLCLAFLFVTLYKSIF